MHLIFWGFHVSSWYSFKGDVSGICGTSCKTSPR